MGSSNRAAVEGTEFLVALRTVVAQLGSELVPPSDQRQGDLPVRWRDETIAYVRATELHGALDRLVDAVERGLGASLADLDRAGKQVAIRQLDEQGAFLLRGAVEDIAKIMNVSRVTLYSYLNAANGASQ